MKNITVIVQNRTTKKLTDFYTVSDSSEIPKIEGQKLFIDCDGDSFLSLENSEAEIAFQKLESAPEFLGLLPVIVLDKTGTLLMQAYADKIAVSLTISKQLGHYFSRSRNSLWLKGETSGHTQKIIDIKYSLKYDIFLYIVEQTVAACHTGNYSCFFTELSLLR
jgi:phosphoribosyl-AMP cyclohydrolase